MGGAGIVKYRRVVVLLAVALALGILPSGCSDTSPETKVIRELERLQSGPEKDDLQSQRIYANRVADVKIVVDQYRSSDRSADHPEFMQLVDDAMTAYVGVTFLWDAPVNTVAAVPVWGRIVNVYPRMERFTYDSGGELHFTPRYAAEELWTMGDFKVAEAKRLVED